MIDRHNHQEADGDGMSGMGYGSGLKGMTLMLLCCLPMIAIVVLLAIGVLK